MKYNTLTFYPISDKLANTNGDLDKEKEKFSTKYDITRQYNQTDTLDKNELKILKKIYPGKLRSEFIINFSNTFNILDEVNNNDNDNNRQDKN